jgi:hypothetical protein
MNATWVLTTILVLALQAAYVRWQLRLVRSIDQMFHQQRTSADAPAEMIEAASPA